MAGDALPPRYRRAIGRFRYGNAVAKVDFALSGPVPWANDEVRLAGTVHVGGTRGEIAYAEEQVASGVHPERPYVLVAQPSVIDGSRAPAGKHVLWAYAHVPSGSTVDMTEAIVAQIERFAPGFRDVIEASVHSTARELEDYNPNYVGGDILSGAMTLAQLVKRPVVSTDPWRTPLPGVYLCGASTPPGASVHGLCGYYAATSALRREFGIREAPWLGLDPQPTDKVTG
jgi:phytoene dehydrogenase-like protein